MKIKNHMGTGISINWSTGIILMLVKNKLKTFFLYVCILTFHFLSISYHKTLGCIYMYMYVIEIHIVFENDAHINLNEH